MTSVSAAKFVLLRAVFWAAHQPSGAQQGARAAGRSRWKDVRRLQRLVGALFGFTLQLTAWRGRLDSHGRVPGSVIRCGHRTRRRPGS
jgi:hypothetical protein